MTEVVLLLSRVASSGWHVTCLRLHEALTRDWLEYMNYPEQGSKI